MIYKDIAFKDIEIIKLLWEKNRVYHENMSQYFGEDYSGLIFEERIAFLGDINPENVKITVAFDEDIPVGYCISMKDKSDAEMVSLHVEQSLRGKGIGKELSNIHFDWFKENKCENINVVVSQENISTISFYKSLGFLPNTLHMKCKM